ncbi:hypothetical protein [Nocardioides sp. B-3]|uniref:hypothetical protein n=1 Tax=Nocardioides sp. B-3 TaxID=2895565 RepID=UPI00215220D8|nr:hypothetical protein [Nocardioides sp. B-3]UUZ60501.1 hypothetical protein LP418_06410 [Nocardioides sp. B-3]
MAACEATANRLVAALCVGDGDEAADSLLEVERLSNDLGGADRLFWAGACRAMVLLQQGLVDDAEVAARAALSLGTEAAIPEAPPPSARRSGGSASSRAGWPRCCRVCASRSVTRSSTRTGPLP